MATPPDAVRAQLAVVTTAAAADLTAAVAEAPPARRLVTTLALLPRIVPAYYDAAGMLAVAWYDERRAESRPRTVYAPAVIGDPETDWIEREVAKFQRSLEADLELEAQRLVDEAAALAEKEVARGFRDTIAGNTRMDEDAIGWSRVARSGACKFCLMLADRGAVYREDTAHFASHKHCTCGAAPEFRNGDHGPEASVMQYVASSKRPRDPAAQAQRNARVREYLNENYPAAPG